MDILFKLVTYARRPPLDGIFYTNRILKKNELLLRFFCHFIFAGASPLSPAPFPNKIEPTKDTAAAKACASLRGYAEPDTTVRSAPRLLSQRTRQTLPWPAYALVATPV